VSLGLVQVVHLSLGLDESYCIGVDVLTLLFFTALTHVFGLD